MPTKSDDRRIWLAGPSPSTNSVPVFAFPHAGGGAAAFRQWRKIAPHTLDICPVQLPGREARSAEPPLDDPVTLVDALISDLGILLEQPFILLGHSLGARLSLKVAIELKKRRMRGPEILIAAAGAPPADFNVALKRSAWSDERLAQYVRELGGTPEEVWIDPELRAMVLPRFRADFALFDAMEGNTPGKVDCPIMAIMGNRDDGITAAAMERWAKRTNASFSLHVMEGDHFFPKNLDCAADIMRLTARAISRGPVCEADSNGPPDQAARSWQ